MFIIRIYLFKPLGCDTAENQCHQTVPQRQRCRIRTVFTDNQTEQLERLFATTDYPSAETRAELAKNTGLSEETVRVRKRNLSVYSNNSSYFVLTFISQKLK